MFASAAVLEPEAVQSMGQRLNLSPVDLKHLRRYTLGDVKLEKEVLELFLAQLPQTIAALNGAKSDSEWRIAAHTLKGSGRAVGAWRLARLAEQAERVVVIKNRPVCGETVKRIEEAADEAKRFIHSTYGACA